jgi:hypothetical protein
MALFSRMNDYGQGFLCALEVLGLARIVGATAVKICKHLLCIPMVAEQMNY